MMLGWLICRFKGHRWSKAKKISMTFELPPHTRYMKHCLRCGIEREVKTRKPKVQS